MLLRQEERGKKILNVHTSYYLVALKGAKFEAR